MLHLPPLFRFRCLPAAMAAAAAAAAGGPGAPLSPDELLPKGDSEKTEEELEEEDDEELDETLSERLWGLTEMFPERVRSAAGATFDLSLFVAQKMYRFSRAALWIGTTSFMILVLPVVFETEKLQMEQQQQLQQRQILLGPNTGLSGGIPGALPSLPGKI
ncbi:mitochondrial import receptor subunit TOM22 homolog isoform X2 [Mirounga angustirostris]|uniref:mitochondrial import receptor subunit TOM22 homolog isoform X2 n=2 Tax=Mirounga TaxID=9714 RepID=UPI001E686597|nr:mitochondrial import receptor subunit TOM22 homolog [Mirounga angustirostris]